MGGTPLRRARSRAQGAALVKNKVYKYWFKSRLKDRLAVAEKRAETLANAGFSACGQPLKCQYRRALIPRLVHIICGKLA